MGRSMGGIKIMDNPETLDQRTREGQMEGRSVFQQVRWIMSEPLTEEEIEMLMWQTPIELPNDISSLPAEEQPDPDQLQLI